jgi:hypothetical protein
MPTRLPLAGASRGGAPSTTSPDDHERIVTLRWPDDWVLRRRLLQRGTPRILIVPHGVAPPPQLDALEDWVRPDVAADDLTVRWARLLALEARAAFDAARAG